MDNNASTPIDRRVLDIMLPFLTEQYANASSSHYFSHSAKHAVKKGRYQIASLIGAEETEIIFTSGSTEAINIALKGVADSYSEKGKHIITVDTEHYAVLDTCRYLESKGYEITYLPVDKDGLIDLIDLKKSLRTDTILVCIMHVNNETGVIQPIKEISLLAHEAGALLMTDATQAAGKISIDVDNLGIDLMCISGHKIYGPKGVGALYVRQRENPVRLGTYTHGGGHEKGVRSGTLNVPGIVALGAACEISKLEMKDDAIHIGLLRDELEKSLLTIPGTYINGSKENRIYNVSNICFPGIEANVLIGMMKNIAVSNGSACTSAVLEASHVLKAMNVSNDDAFASIRFSLGRLNTKREVEIVINTIRCLIDKTG